jgi:hypothetical protein
MSTAPTATAPVPVVIQEPTFCLLCGQQHFMYAPFCMECIRKLRKLLEINYSYAGGQYLP